MLPRAFFPKWLGRFQVCCEEVWPRIWIQSKFFSGISTTKREGLTILQTPPNPPGVIGRGIKTCVFTLISKGFGHCGLCRRAAWWQMWTANGPWILAYGSGSTKRGAWIMANIRVSSVARSNRIHALFHYALSSARCQIQYHRNISNSEEETWVSGFWPFDTISYLGRFLEEIPWNHWARLETLLHVGSARCMYLPSSVRYFFSQDGTNKTGVSGCAASWDLEIYQPTSTRMNLNSIASTFCWQY